MLHRRKSKNWLSSISPNQLSTRSFIFIRRNPSLSSSKLHREIGSSVTATVPILFRTSIFVLDNLYSCIHIATYRFLLRIETWVTFLWLLHEESGISGNPSYLSANHKLNSFLRISCRLYLHHCCIEKWKVGELISLVINSAGLLRNQISHKTVRVDLFFSKVLTLAQFAILCS